MTSGQTIGIQSSATSDANLSLSAFTILSMVDHAIEVGDATVVEKFGCWDAVKAMAAGDSHVELVSPIPGHHQGEVQQAVKTLAIRRIWQRTSTVYAIHPGMLRTLAGAGSAGFPCEILDRIPHSDPLITFPQSPAVITADGLPGRLLAVRLFGRNSQYGLCSSRDPDRKFLGLEFHTALPHGDHDITTAVVPLSSATTTIDEAVALTLTRFDAATPLGTAALHAWLRDYVRLALSTVLYLCGRRPEMTKVPRPRTPRKKGERRDRPVTLINVGYHRGPALMRAYQRYLTTTPGVPTGKRHRPRERAGHHKIVWTGPGRAMPELVWVEPYWVSLDLLEDGAGAATGIHIVDPPDSGQDS